MTPFLILAATLGLIAIAAGLRAGERAHTRWANETGDDE